jgi:hypothetical protein
METRRDTDQEISGRRREHVESGGTLPRHNPPESKGTRQRRRQADKSKKRREADMTSSGTWRADLDKFLLVRAGSKTQTPRGRHTLGVQTCKNSLALLPTYL